MREEGLVPAGVLLKIAGEKEVAVTRGRLWSRRSR